MTAPPLKRQILTCRSKRRHPDELTARAAAMTAIQVHKNAEKLYVYRCPECHGWHLTHKHNSIAQLVTADNPVHVPQEVA